MYSLGTSEIFLDEVSEMVKTDRETFCQNDAEHCCTCRAMYICLHFMSDQDLNLLRKINMLEAEILNLVHMVIGIF